MSIYRKVEIRTWTDARFRALSPIPPSGQGLWLYLLTGPHTGPIPGLFRAGPASLAEALHWEQKAFDEAFQEVLLQGMAEADRDAHLVWLPKALEMNKPASPNVVKSWSVGWDLLPDCPLLADAHEAISRQLKTFGNSYLEAFKTCRKPSATPSRKPSREPFGKVKTNPSPNQEQEQEQEQEQDLPPLYVPPRRVQTTTSAPADEGAPGAGRSEGRAGAMDGSANQNYPDAFERLWSTRPRRAGSDPKPRALQAWRARIREGRTTEDEALAQVEAYRRWCDATGKTGTELVMQLASFFGQKEGYLQDWTPPAHPGGPRNRQAEVEAANAEAVALSVRKAREDPEYLSPSWMPQELRGAE